MIPQYDLNSLDFECEWQAEGLLVSTRSQYGGDSIAFVCEQCEHAAWAYIRYPNRPWVKYYGSCLNHPVMRPAEVHGSMLTWWAKEQLMAMPDAFIEREYHLHLAHYDKEQSYERDTLEAA